MESVAKISTSGKNIPSRAKFMSESAMRMGVLATEASEMRFRTTALAICLFSVFFEPAAAQKMVDRSEMRSELGDACNYFENRIHAVNAIGGRNEGHYAFPLVRACRVIQDSGWLNGGSYKGSFREKIAAHFAYTSSQFNAGRREMEGHTPQEWVQKKNGLGLSLSITRYGDTAEFLMLNSEGMFESAALVLSYSEPEVSEARKKNAF